MVIPMAGAGTRFQESGLGSDPKPLLLLEGMPMIQRVIKNLYDDSINFIFVVLQEHIEKYNIDIFLKDIVKDCKISSLDILTDGPLCSCLQAVKYFNNDLPLFITNSDQVIEDWDLNSFIQHIKKNNFNAAVGTFDSQHPKNSYIQLNDQGLGILLKEKEIISQHATNGMHFWSSGTMFVNSACKMLCNKDTTNNEYYIAPSYNYLIQDGYRVGTYKFNKHFPIGIPEDFKLYSERLKRKDKNVYHN